MTSNNENKPLTEVDILKKNVHDLEEQLHNAYKRIDELNAELIDLRRQQSVSLGTSYS
jgi:predicted RNase H-like nuclease (RuvC/YqgF family)